MAADDPTRIGGTTGDTGGIPALDVVRLGSRAQWQGPAPAEFRVWIWGDIDIMRRRELDRIVEDFRASACRDAVVDLEGVRFMGAVGLTFLVIMLGETEQRSGRLALLNPSDAVRHVLDLTELAPLFRLDGARPHDPGRPWQRPPTVRRLRSVD